MKLTLTSTLHKQIVAVINDVQDLTIATVREDGYPQATTVSYVNDGLTMYFGTSEDSQKARNIARDAKVSATINRDYASWAEIEGLSFAARATLITDQQEIDKASGLLYGKFPQIAQFAPDGAEGAVLIRLQPIFISLLDYRQGFGHTELVEV